MRFKGLFYLNTSRYFSYYKPYAVVFIYINFRLDIKYFKLQRELICIFLFWNCSTGIHFIIRIKAHNLQGYFSQGDHITKSVEDVLQNILMKYMLRRNLSYKRLDKTILTPINYMGLFISQLLG